MLSSYLPSFVLKVSPPTPTMPRNLIRVGQTNTVWRRIGKRMGGDGRMEAGKLDPKAFGSAAGILSGIAMLLLGIVWKLGYMETALRLSQPFYPGLSESPVGILIGVVEGVIEGFVAGYLLAALYNRFL
jgi:hypothetical protein